jgi:hypothetical protein
LREDITNLANTNANLLKHLPARGFFNRFAWFHEPSQGGITIRREKLLSTQQAIILIIQDQHNGHGISSGEMHRGTIVVGTLAAVAAFA